MATIRVINSLYQADPHRVRLVPESPDDAPVVFPQNPESWHISTSPRWQARNAAGATLDQVDYIGASPQRIEWRQTLAVRGYATQQGNVIVVDSAKLSALEEFLETLQTYAQEIDEETGEPRRFVLEMGVHSYSVVVDSLNITRLQSAPDGTALVADIDLALLRTPQFGTGQVAFRRAGAGG